MGSLKGKVWAANKIECTEQGELNHTGSVLRSLQATPEKSSLSLCFQGTCGADIICKEALQGLLPVNTASSTARRNQFPSPGGLGQHTPGWGGDLPPRPPRSGHSLTSANV